VDAQLTGSLAREPAAITVNRHVLCDYHQDSKPVPSKLNIGAQAGRPLRRIVT
jgi:hypothetical protein